MATMPGLRPLGVGEILDTGIKLSTRNWRVLATCAVGFVLPLQILSAIALLSLAPEQLDPATADATRIATTDDPGLLAAEVTIALLQGLTYMLVVGACFKAVADARLGATPSARESLAFLRPRLAAVVAVFVLYACGVALGTFALFVPGVWLAISWSIVVPALLVERLGPADALRRSFRLVQGRWWGVFGAAIVGVLIASLVGAFVESLIVAPVLVGDSSDAVAAAASAIGGTVGSVLVAPFTAAVVALLYLDQRVRKEGLDARALGDAVGDGALAEAAPFGDAEGESSPFAQREEEARAFGEYPRRGDEYGGEPPPSGETRWLPPRPPSAGT